MTSKLPFSFARALAPVVIAVAAMVLPGCRIVEENDMIRPPSPVSAKELDSIAERYVRLVLALGEHDPDYVDAYYGPAGWRDEAKSSKQTLRTLRGEAFDHIAALNRMEPAGAETIVRLRREFLVRQLQALASRAAILEGRKLSFDEESKALYDAVAPARPDSHYAAVLARLDKLLPGRGPLIERYEAFKKEFVIPPDRLDAVFTAAIQEARRRTKKHLTLPAEESFRVEYVTGKPWSGYNWYKGNAHSLIQVNTDLPIYIDRAVDLAAHEGYPGHHVYNVLLEQNLVRERGWVEFTVYPLFSPQSLIAEGSANYGIEMVFPGEEKVEFERDVLFPLAGMDRRRAGIYHDVMEVIEGLDFASNEAARRYLNGEIDARQAAEWLTRHAMMPPDRAEQRVRFIEKYRSYVINYNLGKELVRNYIERRGGIPEQSGRRWEVFGELLSSPRLPSGLQ